MKPIENWEKSRIEEIKDGGNPTYCIIGRDDYDSLCGAIGILYKIRPFGSEGHFIYQGITVMKSYSSRTGIMFA